ncbi:cyclodeaminase/cyclohydrolase family protein [Collinsella sp. zg1085]|uniref:cyclodeaminase/cyclohydrolase family protein n=1 Tax=Collinsella sp. zg1085 TaxID=2844380 RepID=UPI001C0D1DA0|nr:cyclodeaminase/cyclohydrolase family protein [Collinsella sp. zg1085]QWT18208.1 cyclodeaminase/cyclohydrolase family protein [Collinsella sp. zg1085]
MEAHKQLNMWGQQSIDTFTSALAAKTPVPGGGGATAVLGALSSALCCMALHFTQGKLTAAPFEDELAQLERQLLVARSCFIQLIDDDARAFEPLSQAWAIPKDNPCRAKAIDKATWEAAQPPRRMMRELIKLIPVFERMAIIGSPIMRSDVACGAVTARAALMCAAINIEVNADALTNTEQANELKHEIEHMRNHELSRLDALIDSLVTPT